MKNVLKIINENPEIAFNCLSNMYNGKCFIVYTLHSNDNLYIEKYSKQKRAAENHIQKQSGKSYYDDYTQSLVSYNSGLEILEVKESQLLDPCTNKKMWYKHLSSNMSNIIHHNMHKNYIYLAEKIIIDPDLLKYVLSTIEDMRTNKGMEVIKEYEDNDGIEYIEEQKEEIQENNVIKEEPQENIKRLDVSININNELNGIELKFNSKPAPEILEQLKSNGFKWSNRQKIWYAKNTDTRMIFAKSLTGVQSEEVIQVNNVFEYPEINIDDIESYVVSEQLSKRENDSSWVFRTKEINHTEDIQAYFLNYQSEVEEIIKKTEDKKIIYTLKKELQYFKKHYFDNYIARLNNKANNPSWVVTGRSGRNTRKDQKAIDRYNNLMRESIELTDRIKSKISSAKHKIKKVVAI